MDAAKRMTYLKQPVALQKQREGQTLKGMGSFNLSTKRKQLEKSDCLPKKPMTLLEPVVGLKAETKKTVTPVGHGKGKGLMKGPSVTEKPHVLLCEDSKYALEKLSSIIMFDDYEDLSNHATEAIGETGLFCIAQVICPSFYIFLPFSLPCSNFVLLSANVNDEGVDGPLP